MGPNSPLLVPVTVPAPAAPPSATTTAITIANESSPRDLATPIPEPIGEHRSAASSGNLEDEASRRQREAKMQRLKKEKEKAEKEQLKARDDNAVKQHMDMLHRIHLIETTHARLEAEAREREKKERKEEEKKKAAKRSSQAAWMPSRPPSVRPVVDD